MCVCVCVCVCVLIFNKDLFYISNEGKHGLISETEIAAICGITGNTTDEEAQDGRRLVGSGPRP